MLMTFGVRTVHGSKQLVIVHNGLPVELPHVLPMIYPFTPPSSNQRSSKIGSASA